MLYPSDLNRLVQLLQALDLTQSIQNRMFHNPDKFTDHDPELHHELRTLGEDLLIELEALTRGIFGDDED